MILSPKKKIRIKPSKADVYRKPDAHDGATARATDKSAGQPSEEANTEHARAMRAAKDSLREYNEQGEEDRRRHYQNIEIKDHQFYNRTQLLWNDPAKLEPKKHARYTV